MENYIVFITKSLCYHQVYLADELYKIYGDNFVFIQCREPLKFRVEANQEGFERPYLRGLSRSEEERKECFKILKSASVIIKGEVSHKICRHFNRKSFVFYYSERLFKNELEKTTFLRRVKKFIRLKIEKYFPLGKNTFLLSAGAYTPLDYRKYGLFKDNSYKWGYFPYYNEYDWEYLKGKKKDHKINIVWISRLIKFKHPEVIIELAKFLKSQNIDFRIDVVGDGDEKSGELKHFLQDEINSNDLIDLVIMHGKVPAEKVAEFYEDSNIALFTSSSSEGWGVGINEAMNAGSIVVSSDTVGSARYLIKNKENGFIYKFGNQDMLNEICLKLIRNINNYNNVAYNGFKTIQDLWNYKVAAKRLNILIESLKANKPIMFDNGPCSKAELLKESDKIDD